ncbi:MAG TPA: hypothetical protein VGI44_14410, partial [Acidimicrobiales bacterium]
MISALRDMIRPLVDRRWILATVIAWVVAVYVVSPPLSRVAASGPSSQAAPTSPAPPATGGSTGASSLTGTSQVPALGGFATPTTSPSADTLPTASSATGSLPTGSLPTGSLPGASAFTCPFPLPVEPAPSLSVGGLLFGLGPVLGAAGPFTGTVINSLGLFGPFLPYAVPLLALSGPVLKEFSPWIEAGGAETNAVFDLIYNQPALKPIFAALDAQGESLMNKLATAVGPLETALVSLPGAGCVGILGDDLAYYLSQANISLPALPLPPANLPTLETLLPQLYSGETAAQIFDLSPGSTTAPLVSVPAPSNQGVTTQLTQT